MRQQNSTSVTPLKTVGHATPRIDALERVTGKATYTNDIQLPGCSTREFSAARIRTRESAVSMCPRRLLFPE